MAKTDWALAFKPLLAKYKGKKHPLEYKNLYQLLVMVVLSAQDSDKNINKLAPAFFKVFPTMKKLSTATEKTMFPLISKVRNFGNKTNWLMQIAQAIKEDKNIPLTLQELTALPGIGRKSANVIMREAGVPAEGIIVDLHVVHVASRIGVAEGTDPKKIEKQLMEALPEKVWGEVGMAISFLGRETCRPTHPEHHDCVMTKYCAYFKENHKTAVKAAPAKKKAVKKVASISSATKAKKTAKKVAKKTTK